MEEKQNKESILNNITEELADHLAYLVAKPIESNVDNPKEEENFNTGMKG